MRKVALLIALVAIGPLVVAQQVMNNDAIIKLCRAGLSEDLIISTINASPAHFDISTDELITLQRAGASERVIAAVLARSKGAQSQTQPLSGSPIAAPIMAAPISDSDDPMDAHDPGIYLASTGRDGKTRMLFIDRAGAGNEKTSGILSHAFTYGIVKAKLKAELPGPRAAVRTENATPVFYMYFPSMNNAAGLGGTDTITSPAQFSLLSLEDKKDHRETAVAKVGFASVSMGNDEKKVFQFNSNRIRPYVYKLVPSETLKPGEYAFIATTRMAGTAQGATVVIYDFGVDLR